MPEKSGLRAPFFILLLEEMIECRKQRVGCEPPSFYLLVGGFPILPFKEVPNKQRGGCEPPVFRLFVEGFLFKAEYQKNSMSPFRVLLLSGLPFKVKFNQQSGL